MVRIADWKASLTPYWEPARAWFRGLDQRERWALQLLSVAVLITLCWWLVIQPLYQGRAEARAAYIRSSQTLTWLRDNAPVVRQASSNESESTPSSDNWTSRINASAGAHQLTLKGFTPNDSDSVRVMLEDQSFANVLAWLQSLKREQGVQASSIKISRGRDSGNVDVRATLKRDH